MKTMRWTAMSVAILRSTRVGRFLLKVVLRASEEETTFTMPVSLEKLIKIFAILKKMTVSVCGSYET